MNNHFLDIVRVYGISGYYGPGPQQQANNTQCVFRKLNALINYYYPTHRGCLQVKLAHGAFWTKD